MSSGPLPTAADASDELHSAFQALRQANSLEHQRFEERILAKLEYELRRQRWTYFIETALMTLALVVLLLAD